MNKLLQNLVAIGFDWPSPYPILQFAIAEHAQVTIKIKFTIDGCSVTFMYFSTQHDTERIAREIADNKQSKATQRLIEQLTRLTKPIAELAEDPLALELIINQFAQMCDTEMHGPADELKECFHRAKIEVKLMQSKQNKQ